MFGGGAVDGGAVGVGVGEGGGGGGAVGAALGAGGALGAALGAGGAGWSGVCAAATEEDASRVDAKIAASERTRGLYTRSTNSL